MMNEFVLLSAFFCTVLLGIVAAGVWVLSHAKPYDEPNRMQQAVTAALQSLGESLPKHEAGPVSSHKLLVAAGYRWTGADSVFNGIVYSAAILFTGILGGFVFLRTGSLAESFIPALCGGGFGYLIPRRVLEAKIRSRQNRMSSGLPVALDLLVLSLEAGQSFDHAIAESSRELRLAYPELAQEFVGISLSLRASVSRAEVFREFAARNRDEDLAKLANLLADSDRFGTGLAPALRTHARYLRIRRRQQAQEAARKIGVKLVFPIFFLIFPSVLLVTLGPAVLQIMGSFRAMAGD